MRAAGAALVSFLLSKQPYFAADLFTFTFQNGSQLLVTSYDMPVTYGATTWENVGPVISRSRWNVKNTVEIPTLDIELLSTGTDYSGSNIKLLIHQGLFDGCSLLLQRAFMPTSGDTSLGLVTLFGGKAGPISLTPKGAKITFKGNNVLMQQFMPRNRYELGCIHTLYDAGCTLNRATYTASNTVGAGSNFGAINWGTPPVNGGNYSLGYIIFTSGAASGSRRSIPFANSTYIQLAYPLYNFPAVGDTFNVTYGCDKTRDGANGCAFFANQQNFRGFRFIPPAETGI